MGTTNTGNIILVTGAAAGIGRATAQSLAKTGATVIVSDVNEDGGHKTVQLIKESGDKAEFVKADVSDEDSVANLFAHIADKYGQLNAAINNAGIEGKIGNMADSEVSNFDRIIGVNLRGTYLCMKHEIPMMLKQGGGRIVNLSSIAGIIGFPGLSAYVASKHAINGLTKNAALEYGKEGIRVNSVCPGGVDTRMLDSLAGQMGSESSSDLLSPMHPIGRIGKPEEIASLITWLCAGDADFVNGAVIPIDGGFVAQ